MAETPFRVSSMCFNGGDVVDVGDADIVVLVGPNNTGKSRTLAELHARLSMQPGQRKGLGFFVLDDLRIEAELDAEELTAWLRRTRYSWVEPSDGNERVRTFSGGEMLALHVPQFWSSASETAQIGQLAGHLVRGLWCAERLNYLGSPSRLDPLAHPDHPVQWLVQDAEKLETFREAFRVAFNQNVVVDGWGTNIRLRISPDSVQSDFVATTTDGLPNRDVMERLGALPVIEEQSDGVRSFAGMVLTLLTTPYPLILLDEPEAFLHPPQARLLGRYLGDLQRDGQLFVSTHSLDILLGLIQSRPEGVLIIRLTREEGKTYAKTLPPSDLARLWRDPLLRFSRALDGIFHRGVVVCEGDTDSQFYSAVADELGTPSGRDVMFTYAGSKQRIPLITKALLALAVPVVAVVDFDALNDEQTLRNLVEGLGADFNDEMRRLRKIVDAHLRQGTTTPSASAALQEISVILEVDAVLTADKVTAVKDVLAPQTGWRAAKKSGASVVPPGDSTVALERLLALLAGAGLFVVPHGAVESFVRAVPGKGPRWVVDVVEGGHLDEAREARQFVASLLERF